MHSELAGLLHTARFALDDDSPRLVLADWLEEHGDETQRIHAEFLRVALRLARTRPWDADREPLVTRHRELQSIVQQRVIKKLTSFPGIQTIQHERGLFCPHLTPEALKHLDAIFALPESNWIEGVRCWGWDGASIGQLLHSPHCGRLASLGLGDCTQEDLRPHLLSSPHLSQLQHLLIINGQMTSTAWAEIVVAGKISPKTHLCLLGNQIGRASVAAMRAREVLVPVRSLDLSQNRLGTAGTQTVARLRCPALKSLDLGWNEISDKGMESLAGSPLLSNVEELELSSNHIALEGVIALARSPYLGQLKILDLSFNGVTDEAVLSLARSPLMKQLRQLDLRYNRISDTGVEGLLSSPLREQVHQLDLTGNHITDAMKERLARAFKTAFLS